MANLEHHFNTELAEKYGLEESILLQNIAYWVIENKSNERNFYEGRYWTFNSRKAYSEQFPYFTEKQIRRILDNLVKSGLVLKGNFSKDIYNRTNWYTLSDELLKFFKI